MKAARILVVEDEMIIARELIMQLRALGHEPLGSARTGQEAIDMAAQLQPQLVLMDVHLAGAMDGITAAQAIRSQFGIPIVFLSAFEGSCSLERAKLANPVGFLAKPFTEYEFGELIGLALGER